MALLGGAPAPRLPDYALRSEAGLAGLGTGAFSLSEICHTSMFRPTGLEATIEDPSARHKAVFRLSTKSAWTGRFPPHPIGDALQVAGWALSADHGAETPARTALTLQAHMTVVDLPSDYSGMTLGAVGISEASSSRRSGYTFVSLGLSPLHGEFYGWGLGWSTIWLSSTSNRLGVGCDRLPRAE